MTTVITLASLCVVLVNSALIAVVLRRAEKDRV